MNQEQKKELNKLLRQATLARDGGKCVKCERAKKLNSAHIYPKGKFRQLEYDPDNVITLCYRCHFHWWHKDTLGAAKWLLENLLKSRLDRLEIRSQTDCGPADYNSIKLLLKSEINRYGNRQCQNQQP